MIIQIYEIQTPEEAEIMVELGVDHVGSVLISDTDRVDELLKSTIKLIQSSSRKSSLIPLFGHADRISRAVDRYWPDIIHFCEALPPFKKNRKELDAIVTCQRTICERFPELEIMRSIPIGQPGNGTDLSPLSYAAIFESWSDWFLTDTLLGGDKDASAQNQPVKGFVGITGKVCNWDIAADLVRQSKIPVILAGGIGPENVTQGIARVQPAGVDSCSLTNSVNAEGQVERFKKDPQKVRAMINKARNIIGINQEGDTTHDRKR